METKKNTGTKENEKMTKVQKVIVILTFVVLTILLIVFAATRYMGNSSTYPLDGATNVTDRSETTDNSPNDTVHSGDTDDGNSANSGAAGNGSNIQTGGQNNAGNSQKEDNQADNQVNKDDASSNGDTESNTNNQDNFGTTNDDTSSDDISGSVPPASNDDIDNADNSGDNDSSNDDDTATGGISNGDPVTITSISESTVTVRIGGETIVIPVQTTVFNGRVTKSGVISDSLCGYTIGASVMLYYPENGSLDSVTLTGAYVEADSTRLTVSGDYNGDGSKIVFRINGVRLP